MNDSDLILLSLITERLSQEPKLMGPIIDAATAGVKKFADSQIDNSSKLAFMMVDILDHNPDLRTKYFPVSEIFERTRMEGTTWHKTNREKFSAQTKCVVDKSEE